MRCLLSCPLENGAIPLPPPRPLSPCYSFLPFQQCASGIPGSRGAHRIELFHDQCLGERQRRLAPVQAKNIILRFCALKVYANGTCQGVIDEHFNNNPVTEGTPITMTTKFCEESVALLSLDVLNRSRSLGVLLEGNRSMSGGDSASLADGQR